MQGFSSGALFAATLLMAPAAVALRPPQGDGPVVVIGPPWRDLSAVVERAGGREVGPIRAPFAVLAWIDDPVRRGGFARDLRQAGAWAVTDGAALSQICGVEND